MLDLTQGYTLVDSLKQPSPEDIIDLSSGYTEVQPKPEPTMTDKLLGAGKELVDTAVQSIIPSQPDIATTRMKKAESMVLQKEQLSKEKAEAQNLLENPIAGQTELGLEAPILDPLMWPFENAVATGVLKGFATIYDAVKMSPNIRTIMSRMTPESSQEMAYTLAYMEDNGMALTDALVEGSKGSDLRQFLSGHNVFAVRDAFKSQQTLTNDYFSMVKDVTDKIKSKDIDPGNITTWRDSLTMQKEIKQGVEDLRNNFKAREQAAYSEVGKIVKSKNEEFKVDGFTKDLRKSLTEEGVPPEAVNVVDNILNRFAKPFADETKELAKIKKERIDLLVESKQLHSQSRKAADAGDSKLATSVEEKLQEVKLKMSDLTAKERELRDVRYMTTEDLLASVKLINRRLYKPGGAISLKDADELRGLQIAKSKLDEFLESRVTDTELKEKLRAAKDITIARTGLFGAKDSGGEKVLLANLLNKGEYGKVTEYMTGSNAKENILYVRDVFGKDSDTYRNSLGLYLTDKLGMTTEGLQGILANNKVIGVTNKVDIQKAAEKISQLDAQDFSMVRQVAGDKAAMDLKAIQKISTNFADLEDAASKYGRGITSGKLAYVAGEGNILGMAGRGIKLVSDAVTYNAAKVAEKIIYNQPKFRTVTGAAIGETIYLARTEDKDLSVEGAIASLLAGGTAGYYGGRTARSLLESDINKVSRYLKSGENVGPNMSAGLYDSLTRLGTAAKQIDDEAMQMVMPKEGLRRP